MKWAFRWYGENYDSIPLNYIKQVPGVNGIIGTLLNKLPGDIWSISEISKLKNQVKNQGLELLGIESVAIHDSIKAGNNQRDMYINNYIQTLRNLSSCGISLVCYSFKPIFAWAKTNLFYKNNDGSFSLVFDQKVVENMKPSEMYELINSQSKGFKIPGWEEKRLKHFSQLMEMYKNVNEETLFENLKYFLNKVIPECQKINIKLAIHPDDPPWEIFNLPRITKNLKDFKKIIEIIDSPYNGITLCTGSLGANPYNNIPEIIKEIGHRINFVHFRNIKFMDNMKFKEVAHETNEGSLDMYKIMKSLIQVGFNGVIRPDHGRSIWEETSMPGYGLYDRALGMTYAHGLYEAITKQLN